MEEVLFDLFSQFLYKLNIRLTLLHKSLKKCVWDIKFVDNNKTFSPIFFRRKPNNNIVTKKYPREFFLGSEPIQNFPYRFILITKKLMFPEWSVWEPIIVNGEAHKTLKLFRK